MNTVLRCTISSMPARPPSRPNPLCLNPPKGVVGEMPTPAVDDHGPRLELADEALDAMHVAGVEVGRQAERAVVRLCQGFVFASERGDGLHGAEHLVAGQVAVVVDVARRRWGRRTIPAARSPSRRCPPARSVAPSARARSITPRIRSMAASVTTGPTNDAGSSGSPTFRDVERGEDLVHHLVVDVVMHIEPGRERAPLPGQQCRSRHAPPWWLPRRGRRRGRRCSVTCRRARGPAG